MIFISSSDTVVAEGVVDFDGCILSIGAIVDVFLLSLFVLPVVFTVLVDPKLFTRISATDNKVVVLSSEIFVGDSSTVIVVVKELVVKPNYHCCICRSL